MERTETDYSEICAGCGRNIPAHSAVYIEYSLGEGYNVYCLACAGTNAERDEASLYEQAETVPEIAPDFRPELCPPYVWHVETAGVDEAFQVTQLPHTYILIPKAEGREQ